MLCYVHKNSIVECKKSLWGVFPFRRIPVRRNPFRRILEKYIVRVNAFFVEKIILRIFNYIFSPNFELHLYLYQYNARPILILTQRVRESAEPCYEQCWMFAKRSRNASVDGASTISSSRWFQSTIVLTKNAIAIWAFPIFLVCRIRFYWF